MNATMPKLDPLDQKINYLVEQTVAFATELLGTRPVEPLAKLAERTQTPAVRVIVVGEVSRGKSTLINALIGQSLMPDAAAALTSTWTLLRHGQQLIAEATVVSREGIERVPLINDDIGAYMTLSGERLVRKRHGKNARVASVEIEVPAPVLAGGLELIDTPGVGGLAAAHRYTTLTALQEADAVLFVIKPGEPISATERKFLSEAVRQLDTCIIVQTQRDLASAGAAWLTDDMKTLRDADKWEALVADRTEAERLAKQFDQAKSVSVSALNALETIDHRGDPINAQIYEQSGIPQLIEILNADVVARGYTLHRMNVLQLVESIVRECRKRLSDQITMLTASAASQRLIDERKERVSKWIATGGSFWRPVLNNSYEDLAEEIAEFAKRRADDIDRDYRRRFHDLSTGELVKEVQVLLNVPEAVLAELNRQSAERLAEAVAKVRVLLDQDELGGPLARLEETRAVFKRLPTSFRQPQGRGDLTDVRALLAGGTAMAGAAGLGVAALVQSGVAVAAPIVIPFLAGAMGYLLINRKTREKKRTLQGALETLALVRDEIKNTVTPEAVKAAALTKDRMIEVIEAGLRDLEVQVTRDREDLCKTEGLSSEERQELLKDAEQEMRHADDLLNSVTVIRGQLS